jgi:hypothetical protein
MRIAYDGRKHNKNMPKKRSARGVFRALVLFAAVVFLYLARLEYHTGADILFPANYHSVMNENAETGTLDAYYEDYATQEGRPYTIRQDLLLSRLAYIIAPTGYRGDAEGVTVGELCGAVQLALGDETLDAASVFGRNREEINDLLAGLREYPHLSSLVIREYISSSDGLAGYVLENNGEITMTLRGTDDLVDALDNALLLPFNISVQYSSVRELLRRYGDAERIWLTGHSKGGHNAIYAASIDPRCRATAFNAPGFGVFLSDRQHDGLDYGVNYVINGDVTGFLLFHLERRVVLESADAEKVSALSLNGRHRLNNFFLIDSLAVSEDIQPISVISEWATQIVWLLLLFGIAYALFSLVRKMILRIANLRR